MKLRRWMALLGAALCLLLCACGIPMPDSQDAVVIWSLEGDALLPPLQQRIDEYNEDPGGLLPVRLRTFPDEESLAAAFKTARPDLLLCTHARATALYESGVLQDIRTELGEGAPQYPESMTSVFEGMGCSYYPVGSAVTLLYAERDKLPPAAYGNLESLCRFAAAYGEKEGSAFFTADSFSALFYQGMLSWKAEFHARPQQDERSEVYVTLFNLVTNGAFTGGIVSADIGGKTLVESGALPCAAVDSTQLIAATEDGKIIVPLPGLKETKELLGCCQGFAVTLRPGRSSRSVTAFLQWLFAEGRANRLALDAGMVPAMIGAAPAANSALDLTLLQIGRDYRIHLPDPTGDYWRSEESFEKDFRAALTRFL